MTSLEVSSRLEIFVLDVLRPQQTDGESAANIEDDGNELFTSRTSIWELSATVAAGRIVMPGNTIQSLIDQIDIAGLTILELENRYILRTETLPYHHKDPFDRIVIAQALEENMTILSSDGKFSLYDAPVIWK